MEIYIATTVNYDHKNYIISTISPIFDEEVAKLVLSYKTPRHSA
jgi:hypothetical protein